MINFNSIIGSAAAGSRFIRYQTGVAKTSYIYPVFHMKIVAPEFPGIFTDAINSRGFNDSLLRAILFWRCRSEYSDRRRPEYFMQFFFPGNIQHIQKTLHIQVPGKPGIFFTGGGKNSS